MRIAAVPVTFDRSVIGYLTTGPVLGLPPDLDRFEAILGGLGRKDIGGELHNMLRDAYFHTRSSDPAPHAGAVALLQYFAEEVLSRHAANLVIMADEREPLAVKKAREFIRGHLDSSLGLGEVARAAGVSESHLCRLFRESTGLTLARYTAHSRVERAKDGLIKPAKRISEIAYEVGYRSISQFNRDFVRPVGSNPTAWRHDRIAELMAAPELEGPRDLGETRPDPANRNPDRRPDTAASRFSHQQGLPQGTSMAAIRFFEFRFQNMKSGCHGGREFPMG